MIYNYEYNGKFCSETKYVVYLITNTVSNKFYIGQTRRELRKRWADYVINLMKPIKIKKRTGCNIHLRRSVQKQYKKQGNANFLTFSVLEIIDQENIFNNEQKQNLLNEREIHWIHYYRSEYGNQNVYNIKDGGQVPKSDFSIDPEKTRLRLSIARKKFLASESGKLLISELSKKLKGRKSPLKGKILSKEHREKIKLATQGINNPNYGKKHSEETKRKIGEKNKQISEKTRKERSEALKGKTPFNKNKKWNEIYDSKTIERMKLAVIESNKNRITSEETRNKHKLRSTGKKWGNHSEEQKQIWKEQRKNISYEERYGEERAKEIKKKLQNITKLKFTKTYDLSSNPLVSPDGVIYTKIIGLYEFAKAHKLHPRLLKEVLSNKRKTYKDWHLQATEV